MQKENKSDSKTGGRETPPDETQKGLPQPKKPLLEKLRKKLEKLKKEDPNIYPLY